MYQSEFSFVGVFCDRSPLLYYDVIYMMTPDYWRYRRACKIVHKFSMDVIKQRRAVLEEKKVCV